MKDVQFYGTKSLCATAYFGHLTVRAVVGVCQERLWEAGQEVLEHGGALVDRELVVVQVEADSAVEPLLQRLLLLQVAVLAEQTLNTNVVVPAQVLD